MAKFVQLKDGFDPDRTCGLCGAKLNDDFEALDELTEFVEQLLQLTEWNTGEAIYVDPTAIRSMRQLKSEVSDLLSPPHELGRRTRIDTATDMFCVKEDATEIMAMIASSTARTIVRASAP